MVEMSHGPSVGRTFVGHGTNQRPLQQLKGLLDMWDVPYSVAQDEPHVGRTLHEKVESLMRQCVCGVFLCTGDDRGMDNTGVSVFRPRQNVILELGMAMQMYERRIVICKEDIAVLPTNCSNLGFIEFKGDNLVGSAEALHRELVAIGAIRSRPAPQPRMATSPPPMVPPVSPTPPRRAAPPPPAASPLRVTPPPVSPTPGYGDPYGESHFQSAPQQVSPTPRRGPSFAPLPEGAVSPTPRRGSH